MRIRCVWKRKGLRHRSPNDDPWGEVKLFDFDFGTSSFELLLDLFSFFFLGTFFKGLGSALNELLGFRQAQAGHYATHFFNDGNFVATSVSEDDVKFSFLFDNSGRTGSWASGGDGHRSSGAHAPLVFEGFDEFSDFENGQAAQVFNEFCNISHVFIIGIAVFRSSG